jgi:hypothetical protein
LSVHAHWFCVHVQVLHPSGDGFVSPSLHCVPHAMVEHAHSWFDWQVHVLQPSGASVVAPTRSHAPPPTGPFCCPTWDAVLPHPDAMPNHANPPHDAQASKNFSRISDSMNEEGGKTSPRGVKGSIELSPSQK